MNKIIFALLFTAVFVAVAQAQSGGPYTIERSAIAGGGGTSTGGTFSLRGTIGQAIAGGPATNSPYSLQSGFWNGELAPTAAGVSIRGKVTFVGRPVSGSFVVITLGDGTIRQARTNAFGYFAFDDLLAGQTILIDVQSRRRNFTPQLIGLTDSIMGLELQVF